MLSILAWIDFLTFFIIASLAAAFNSSTFMWDFLSSRDEPPRKLPMAWWAPLDLNFESTSSLFAWSDLLSPPENSLITFPEFGCVAKPCILVVLCYSNGTCNHGDYIWNKVKISGIIAKEWKFLKIPKFVWGSILILIRKPKLCNKCIRVSRAIKSSFRVAPIKTMSCK